MQETGTKKEDLRYCREDGWMFTGDVRTKTESDVDKNCENEDAL